MSLLPSSQCPSYLASVSPCPYWEVILLSSSTLALDIRTLEKILGRRGDPDHGASQPID